MCLKIYVPLLGETAAANNVLLNISFSPVTQWLHREVHNTQSQLGLHIFFGKLQCLEWKDTVLRLRAWGATPVAQQPVTSLWSKSMISLCGWTVFLYLTSSPLCVSLTRHLVQSLRSPLQPWQISGTAFVGRANYTTCHVGRVAGSRAHGRFSGFNYISLAGHWGERN